jgi:hypothetical protein
MVPPASTFGSTAAISARTARASASPAASTRPIPRSDLPARSAGAPASGVPVDRARSSTPVTTARKTPPPTQDSTPLPAPAAAPSPAPTRSSGPNADAHTSDSTRQPGLSSHSPASTCRTASSHASATGPPGPARSPAGSPADPSHTHTASTQKHSRQPRPRRQRSRPRPRLTATPAPAPSARHCPTAAQRPARPTRERQRPVPNAPV